MTTTPVDLDHLEKLHAEATRGEWHAYQPHDQLADGIAAGDEGGYFIETTAADARAIAATHNALPALIAEVRALRSVAHVAKRFGDEVDTDEDRESIRAALAKVHR